jgi:hypothetical protein
VNEYLPYFDKLEQKYKNLKRSMQKMINYEEITLAQAENLFNFFNFECSGDEQKIRLRPKKAFYESIKTLNNFIKALSKTIDILVENIPIYENYNNGKVLDS